jgi:hypothetical protein
VLVQAGLSDSANNGVGSQFFLAPVNNPSFNKRLIRECAGVLIIQNRTATAATTGAPDHPSRVNDPQPAECAELCCCAAAEHENRLNSVHIDIAGI